LSGPLPIYTGREPEGGAHLAGGRGLQVFSVLRGCAGGLPNSDSLRGRSHIRNRTSTALVDPAQNNTDYLLLINTNYVQYLQYVQYAVKNCPIYTWLLNPQNCYRVCIM